MMEVKQVKIIALVGSETELVPSELSLIALHMSDFYSVTTDCISRMCIMAVSKTNEEAKCRRK